MAKSQKMTIQQALQDLEKIVETLGSKDLDVDQGIEKFKQGVALITFCRSQLKHAENEFQSLKKELEKTDELDF